MRCGQPGGEPDEYPQAIADDYPGWGIRCDDGRWTAWCPAATVHARTAAGLRAAIEYAITGDAPD
ncbi:MAG TPA: hypothetical protein VMV92_31605 [Streptosporangiaceae bacterium]|nr:hypothetical protein [Streptosporangiaceae bacterium]